MDLSQTREQEWTLDTLGNWSSIRTNGSTATRAHDKQNGITSTDFAYDDNGNLTQQPVGGSNKEQYVFDAWNRLVSTSFTPTAALDQPFVFTFDALGRRIEEGTAALSLPTTHLYYSDQWQVILEQTVDEGGTDNGTGGGDDDLGTTTTDDRDGRRLNAFETSGITNRYAYVWSPDYVDSMVTREK